MIVSKNDPYSKLSVNHEFTNVSFLDVLRNRLWVV
jgi:hypothetical protein